MDLSYGEEYEKFREELRGWLSEHWPPQGADAELPRDEQTLAFRKRAIDAGFLCRAIPKRYGGSEQPADPIRAQVIREEFRRAHAPGEALGILMDAIESRIPVDAYTISSLLTAYYSSRTPTGLANTQAPSTRPSPSSSSAGSCRLKRRRG